MGETFKKAIGLTVLPAMQQNFAYFGMSVFASLDGHLVLSSQHSQCMLLSIPWSLLPSPASQRQLNNVSECTQTNAESGNEKHLVVKII